MFKNLLIERSALIERGKHFGVVLANSLAISSVLILSTPSVNANELTQASSLTQADRLTQQWLDTDRQTSHLVTSWQRQKPVLNQRLTLLAAEKKQLEGILKQGQDSQEDVTIKRTELLQQQSRLEQQQTELTNKLTLLDGQIERMFALLPPPLKNKWQQEQAALPEEPQSSDALQLALAKLSSLMDFQQRISVHEAPISITGEDAVMVKQLYLGVGAAWFVSADGKLKGRGYAKDNTWTWVEEQNIDAAEIQKAIEVFERRQQADFVTLPVILAASNQQTDSQAPVLGGQQ